MSEEILKVFLADLQTIRVTCVNCKITMEMNLTTLGERMQRNECPVGVCQQKFSFVSKVAPGDYNAFVNLEKSLRHLQEMEDQEKIKIEFPVKIGDGSQPAKDEKKKGA